MPTPHQLKISHDRDQAWESLLEQIDEQGQRDLLVIASVIQKFGDEWYTVLPRAVLPTVGVLALAGACELLTRYSFAKTGDTL